jgi:DNA-binding SARP family transcriptional activator/TolB-like protein
LIRLHLLGGPRFTGERAAERRRVLAQPRRVALLAYLALRAQHGPERRDRLLGLFWPESDANHARGALRNALHFLRVGLGPGAIRSIGSEEVQLDLDLVECDAVEFDRLCDAGELALALRLYEGDLLEGFFVSDASGFEHWLDSERERLRQRAANAARALAAEAVAGNEPGLAILHLRHLLELAPTDEAGVRQLMRLLASADDRGQALQVFADLEARFRREYGLEPAVETRALADTIRAGSARAQAASPGAERPAEVPAAHTELAPAAQVPGPARASHRSLFRRWPLHATAAGLTLVIGLSAAALLWRSGPPVASSDRVAVLPFEYRGAEEHAYLADGLADLLSANLDGAGDLRAVDPRAFLPAAQHMERPIQPAAARREAEAHGAGLFVLGSATEAGGRIRIAATLYGPHGQLTDAGPPWWRAQPTTSWAWWTASAGLSWKVAV